MPRIFFLCLAFLLPAALIAGPAPELEAALRPIVDREAITIVHTWAPWCINCRVEMEEEGGWVEFIEEHPEVEFVFVEIWNDGRDSVEFLRRYGVEEQTNFTRLVDPNPRRGDERTTELLGQQLTWVPSTWVYQRGRVRYAILYGEVRFDMLDQMIADTQTNWSR